MKDSYTRFARVAVVPERRSNGVILLDNAITLPAFEGTLLDRLARWAIERPAAVFLSEAHGDTRRSVTYGEAAQTVDRLGAHLLALPVSTDRPLTLIGANGIAHALVMLAATRVGLPVAIISPTHCSAVTRPWTKLQRMIERLDSGFVLADDTAGASDVFAAFGRGDIPVRPLRDLAWIDELPSAEPDAVAQAAGAVTGDTVAKLLFTSGSTGAPKAVMNTQAMMVSNMAGLAAVWPFLGNRPPVLVDWLPWSHTFGGNCCFNVALYFGGTLHIDDRRPLPGHIERTVATLRRHRPTVYFNVPAGYEALLPFLEADHDFAADFFGALDIVFNAGAALPERLRTRLKTLAHRVTESRRRSWVGGDRPRRRPSRPCCIMTHPMRRTWARRCPERRSSLCPGPTVSSCGCAAPM
ncbi:AMP-binding protein [Sphingomonas sp. RB3P16]|uniref:AMP-binding protein n=1 Tax=Parasphingomonas frigoris TaxID=3096163 RepID=UPI002FC914C0